MRTTDGKSQRKGETETDGWHKNFNDCKDLHEKERLKGDDAGER